MIYVKAGPHDKGLYFFMIIIFDYNRTIFNPEVDSLYEGVSDILRELSINHKLMLVSKKEDGRDLKFRSLGIGDYFTKIDFVKEKNMEVFSNLIENTKEKVLVVGDRIRGEISIGNQLNFTTVWVKQGKFSNEVFQNDYEIPDHSIDDIRQLLEIVKIYE